MFPVRIHRPTFATYVKTGATLAALLLIGWYGYFQAHSLIAGPQIVLEQPETPLQHEQIINVEGYARNITELTLNGRAIHTDEEGRFEAALVLPEGYTIMTLHAKDRYGRDTTLSRELVYKTQRIMSSI